MGPVFWSNTVVELYTYETYQQIFPYSVVFDKYNSFSESNVLQTKPSIC